jgi:protein gp37
MTCGKTEIRYLTRGWNPVSGCTPISAACKNCWAAAVQQRFRGGDFSPQLHPDLLNDPLRLRDHHVVGVSFTGDLFHDAIPADYIYEVLARIAAAPQHNFVLLTKRTSRMREICLKIAKSNPGDSVNTEVFGLAHDVGGSTTWPLPNLWAGTTVEDQPNADVRVPILLEVPAAHLWISMEPQIGPIDLGRWMSAGFGRRVEFIAQGCESGAQRRPFQIDWARQMRDACRASGTIYYLKQSPESDETGKRSPVLHLPVLDGRQHLELPW